MSAGKALAAPAPSTARALKEIRLDRLTLSQFKGVRRFTLDAGGDLVVYGDNASGKTTLATAFAWLLFGKDSSGKADFEIKTLDVEGEPMHGLDHSVRAKLTVGDDTIELEKIYREKWQKRRGQADREFTGHTTQHFLDSVPVKEKEYQAAIAEIADEGVFRLLTDPAHFAERLHWQARREILLEVCGDVPDADVIASAEGLADLPEILGARSIDDHRKVAQARKRKINEELQRVPVRIDEVSRSRTLGTLATDEEESAIRSRLAKLREKRAVALRTQARIDSGGEIAEKTKRLRELEGELLEEANRARSASTARADTLRRALRGAEMELDAAKREATRLLHESEDTDEEIVSLQARMEEQRAEWRRIDEAVMTPRGSSTCAACGQPLPPDKVAAAQEKALAEWNAEKSRRLEGIDSEGKRLRARADQLAAENGKRWSARKDAEARAEKLAGEVGRQLRQIEDLAIARPNEEPSDRERGLIEDKIRIEAEIAALHESNAGALETAATGLQELDGRIAAIEAELSKVEQRRAAEKRFDELRKGERRLAAEYEALERELFLLEEFTRRKVSMLTERINSRFEMARFRLFEELVSGGLQEVCEASVDGVPYQSLNNGSRINAGLEIIDVLAKHYGVAPPVFIDQSESITRLRPTLGQQIRLVVSAGDKTLRVERIGRREE